MREVKNMKVEIVDEDHIFVNNKQFVSLKRFSDAKKDMANEVKLLNDKNKELAEENEALEILLKNRLNGVEDDSSIETFVNRMCQSDGNHEWEYTGMSTAGVVYTCKKCFARKTVTSPFNPYNITVSI